MVYVEFTDSAETKIMSVFGSTQDPSIYRNQGAVSTSDERWATFYAALPVDARGAVPTPTAE